MGLPNINVDFFELGVSSIQRSGRGIVALIVKDDLPTFETIQYKRLDEIDKEKFTPENYDYIKNVFKGTPSKVIVEVMKTTGLDTSTVSEVLTRLSVARFNYLAMPDADELEKEEISTFIKTSNSIDKKTFKAVLANVAADHESVINFTTEDIRVGGKIYTAGEFTSRIAGILAGLSLDRSATYFVIPEIENIKSKADPDACIDNGELILIDDGEKIKIARGVNSLTTIVTINGRASKGDSFKKIKIVEGVHLIKDDIRRTFENSYVGKYINDYDNKVLFLTAVNSYFKQLVRAYVLDGSYANKAEVSLEQQIIYIEGKGVSTETMTEQEIKEYNTGSNVFASAKVKLVDAMEDLDFDIFM